MLPGWRPTSTVPVSRPDAMSTSESVVPSKWETHSEPPITASQAADRPVRRTIAAGRSSAGVVDGIGESTLGCGDVGGDVGTDVGGGGELGSGRTPSEHPASID